MCRQQYSHNNRLILFVAMVTILETDPETDESYVRTAAFLGKGNSFGVSCNFLFNIFVMCGFFLHMDNIFHVEMTWKC